MKKCFVAMLLISILALGFATASTASGDAVLSACSSCHNLKRVCVMLGVKDRAGWETTINRMIKNGAKVTPGQVGSFVDYLTAQAPGSGPVCQ